MELNKVTIIGGGVLGSQIGLMCAYVGKDVTFWLRSEGSVSRTKPKLDRYAELMITDLLTAKALIGSPMGKFVDPRGMIRNWDTVTAEEIDARIKKTAKTFGLEGMLDRRLYSLSGGEKQVALLACIHALGSRILILDEAFANIDRENAEELLSLISLLRENGSFTCTCGPLFTQPRLLS